MKNNHGSQKTALSPGEAQRQSSWIYNRFFEEEQYELKARFISLANEIQTIHRWVNMAYSRKYWQMQGSSEEVFRYYHMQVNEGKLALFFICYNQLPVAQIEVYNVLQSELVNYYAAGAGDYGIHTLLAPYREIMQIMGDRYRNIAVNVLKTVQEMLFSFKTVSRIVTEPDATNINACRLAEKAGFKFIKKIQLPDKLASFYSITREDFERSGGGIR